MSTHPAWSEEKDPRSVYPPVTGDLETDVAIVGGGITGLTTAYHLAKAGKRVTLLEQDKIVSGDSGRTTAFFTYVVDAPLAHLKRTFGEEAAKHVWASNRDAIDAVEKIVREEGIDCDFMRCSAIVYAHDEKGRADLRETAMLGKTLGFPVAFTDSDAALGFAAHGFLLAPDQAKLHPMKYLQALAARAEAAGADIRERTHVHAIENGGRVTLVTSGGRVRADDVVIATHGPITHPLQLPSRLKAERTYVLQAAIPVRMLPEGLYWNTENPYHYFRVDRGDGEDRLTMGGEDHLTGQSAISEEARFEALKNYFRALLPKVPMKFFAHWSGQIYESIDGLPYIGRPIGRSNEYVATGYNGNGMTFGTIAARVISNLILTGQDPLADLYRTARPHGAGPMAELGADFAREMLQGRLRPDAISAEQIVPGHGAILVEHGKPIAVYKDEHGGLTRRSGACTHMHCTVRWNDAERSWDCPCHGSRFGPDGKVLNGPAITPLDPA